MIYALIACIVLVIVEGLIIFIFAEKNKTLKKESANYESKITTLTNNVAALKQYAEGYETIKNWADSVKEKIQNAKTQSDNDAIVADIIAHNNARVPDAK